MKRLAFALTLFLAVGGRWAAAQESDSAGKPEPEAPQTPPVLKVMTEVDGIQIPRVTRDEAVGEWKAAIPVDVGNVAAQRNPGKKATGGRIAVRISYEPRTMNPITETSAVQSLISDPYLIQPLAGQNPETFKFEPMLAKRWIVEDSVKLSPELPGKERYLQLEGGDLVTETTHTFRDSIPGAEPSELKISTYGPDRTKLGQVWIGLFPAENQVGTPQNGYHFWSDKAGNLTVSGVVPGRYRVLTGYEIFGTTEQTANGRLKVTPASPQNPLQEILGPAKSLELATDDYVDIQRETVLTFEIEKDACWSDGVSFTSQDLAFGYAVIGNPVVDGDSLRSYYNDLIRCDPLDQHTIQMQYRHQYFHAFAVAAGLAAYSPPWHVFQIHFRKSGETLTLEKLTEEEEGAQHKVSVHGTRFGRFFNSDVSYNMKPIGTGPYVIDRWVADDRIVLKRNLNYWTDKQKGYLDEITFKFITDDVTALQALKAEEIDFLYRLPADQMFEALQPEPVWFQNNYVKASWYIPSYSYIGWNEQRPQFQDRRVRLALSLLLDVEKLLQQAAHGRGVLISGSPYYFSPSYDHNVKPVGYDPETARKLLEAAGWSDTDGDGVIDNNGQPFEFTFLISSASRSGKFLGAMLQEECKKAGIRVNVDELEWASFLEKIMNKDFDAVTLGWMAPIESDPYLIWHSSGAGTQTRSSNHISFNNPVADELIEQLRVTLDPDRRAEIYHNFHRLLDREQPYTFLYTPKEFGAYHNRYRGVKWYRVRPGFDLTEWYVPQELQRD